MPRRRECTSPPSPRKIEPHEEKLTKSQTTRPPGSHDLRLIQQHYAALEKSKLGVLAHVASQHSVLDVLYGGDTGRPMPSWTYQTTPEVGVSDQQHTGRCWIFATLAVLGHVFRSQYGISNSRATFSEGYLGFWDLYEKSRLFLHVAYDTRCVPLDDPSLCDLLKGGISDGGDYIFCLNLLDRYGIVPTEYYPNSSYGSMSTEALVTLINQVLRDNAITLRSTADESLIPSMLTNIFAILCMGLGTPPAPWKKLDWQVDQCETMAQFAVELAPTHVVAATMPAQQAAIANVRSAQATSSTAQSATFESSSLPPEPTPWRASVPVTYPVKIPPKTAPVSSTVADLVAALNGPAQERTLQPEATAPPVSSRTTTTAVYTPPPSAPVFPDKSTMDFTPPSPTGSNVTAAAMDDWTVADEPDTIPSTARVVTEESAVLSGEPQISGLRPPRPVIDIPTRESKKECVDISGAGTCRKPGGFFQRLRPAGCQATPKEGSGEFFRETMPDSGCLLGRQPTSGCRLSHTISERPRAEDAMSFDYTPRDFYYRFMCGVKYIPVVCDERFPSGTRIISNDANMYGGLPSMYLNVTIDDIEAYTIASLKRNIPVWFACDVKKQLTPEGGRMCNHTDRLAELLPEPHRRGTKLEEIRHFNAIANHALLISAVSIKNGKPVAWRIVNSWGDVGRNAGIFVACNDWFREHVYSINAVQDTMKREHRDQQRTRPTVRLGPFDPSVI